MEDETASKPVLGSDLTAILEENKHEAEEESEVEQSMQPSRACLDDVITENLVSNLIENVKLDANLNEDKATIVASSVIKTLSENIHPWAADCKKILGGCR